MAEEAKRFEKESDHPDYYMQWSSRQQQPQQQQEQLINDVVRLRWNLAVSDVNKMLDGITYPR